MSYSDAEEQPPSMMARLRRWVDRVLPAALQSRGDLLQVLNGAQEQNLMGPDALSMIEGVLQVSELQVRDIMIPRAKMVVVNKDAALPEVLSVLTESAHSRFPVIGEDRGEVVGILLAKDLLQFCNNAAEGFSIREVLRSAVFVPESKRLNVLLKEFRVNRNHMAIVVDEYGAAAGLVTIEDVLEQIVGEIEDEHDFDEGAFIFKRGPNEYTAKAHTSIEDFNDFFSAELEADDVDTLGGLVSQAMGHVPKRGESVQIEDFRFSVVRADSRKVWLLSVERLDAA
ncbi:MAG: HlyC/CorC family transporter [bacterium]